MSSHAEVVAKFQKLADELHLPFLDWRLYHKYLVLQQTPNAAGKLCELVDTMARHRANTLMVLDAIAVRSEVLKRLYKLVEAYEDGVLTTLELQSEALRELYELQKKTLIVVEGIMTWREGMTRPYAFYHSGANYILSIAQEYLRLEQSHLSDALPLKLSKHPLFTNIPSLKLFGTSTEHVTYPLKKRAANVAADVSPAFRRRLEVAEKYIHSELETQMRIIHEMMSLCAARRFVPVLAVSFVPNNATGIKIQSPEWEERLAASLVHSLRLLQRPPLTTVTGGTNTTRDEEGTATGSGEGGATSAGSQFQHDALELSAVSPATQ